MTRHIGGSLLPSAGWDVYGVKPGLHGSFETRPLEEHDTHGLFYSHGVGETGGEFVLIASHPNGYSCDELAKRMIAAWAGGDGHRRALDQFDYILACGGVGVERAVIEDMVEGNFDETVAIDLSDDTAPAA
jgi:hypothetical protein